MVFIFRGLKDLVTPVLAGILESEPANAMSFEEFFARIQDILSRKVIASVKNIVLLYSSPFFAKTELLISRRGLSLGVYS